MSNFLQKVLPISANFKEWLSATFAPTAHTHDDRYYTEDEVTTLLATKSDFAPIPYKNMGRMITYPKNCIYQAPCDGYLVPQRKWAHRNQYAIFGGRADYLDHLYNTSTTDTYNYGIHKSEDGTYYQSLGNANVPDKHALTDSRYWIEVPLDTPAIMIALTSATGEWDAGMGSCEYIPVRKDDCFTGVTIGRSDGMVYLGSWAFTCAFVPLDNTVSPYLVYLRDTTSQYRCWLSQVTLAW